MKKALAWALLALLGSTPAAAEGVSESPAHRFTVYAHSGAGIYLSDTRTLGGIGGGVGVRDTLDDRFILQADLGYLGAIGNAAQVRVGAGLQRRGMYTPAALLVLTGMVGSGLHFLTPEHPTPISGPLFTLGVQLAPLRFTTPTGMQVSVLELGLGASPELPGLGLSYQVNLLEVGTSF
ncbi:hypothetical protein JRI60_37635 [Archangium violaceum]|uniref:hypothetical protein n=1 Tax=Archangium violaceum TaxID=83451 RepID=UPI00195109FB|nr:hypothetical protein [Archangium violaceum]QRN94796.1 hypothetical protein JRI60_37635 [Archangium violaceum]